MNPPFLLLEAEFSGESAFSVAGRTANSLCEFNILWFVGATSSAKNIWIVQSPRLVAYNHVSHNLLLKFIDTSFLIRF